MKIPKKPIDETVDQLQRMSDLLDYISGDVLNAWINGIEVWLKGEFMRGATNEWRDATRYSQAAQYIEWLEREGDL